MDGKGSVEVEVKKEVADGVARGEKLWPSEKS